MATKKKPLAKLLEEVDTKFFQVGVKKAGLYDLDENATEKHVIEKQMEIEKALNEYDAAENLYQEALEEEYEKIRNNIDKKKQTIKKTYSQYVKERDALYDRYTKKEHQKTDKLKELHPDNPKIKLLNLDILKLLKDIYTNKYLYSKTEKNTNNNVKASKKKEPVKETECDIDGISKYITKKSLVQAASEKLIKGRWSMNKATLVNELKKKFKTLMEFCEYIQGLYNTSTKKKPTAKKNVKFSKKKQ